MKNKKIFLFPTIKMADLFDVKMGGAGWHLTSHLIAIAALFVACFAITGYISFRDNTVGSEAIKDDLELSSLTLGSYKERVITAFSGSGFGTIAVATPQFLVSSTGATPSTSNRVVLPKGCIPLKVVVTATTALTSGGSATIDIGYQTATDTAADNNQLIAAATLASLNTADEQILRTLQEAATGTNFLAADNVLVVDADTAALTAGAIRVEVFVLERV